MTLFCFADPAKKNCTNFTVGWGAPDRTYSASCTYWASAGKKSPLNLLTQYKFVVFYHQSTFGREISWFTIQSSQKNTQKCFVSPPGKKKSTEKKISLREWWEIKQLYNLGYDGCRWNFPETFPKNGVFWCLHSYSNPPLWWMPSNLPALLETR